MSNKNKILIPKRKKEFIQKDGSKEKGIIASFKNANVLFREEQNKTVIIINDCLMLTINGGVDSSFEMEKTSDGFKIKENQQDVYYKVPKVGSWYIHREDGPAVINEDYGQYHWYYEGKPLRGMTGKKSASAEEYSLYVLQEFGIEK